MIFTPKIFDSEFRFCLIMWENAPITCSEISRICSEKLTWSRTTTYTVIKRLSQRRIIKVEKSVITPIISKEEAQKYSFDELFEKRFEGSIINFINVFAKDRTLTPAEAEAFKAAIDASVK